MIRWRLAQSNTWVYTVQKTTEGFHSEAERDTLRREAMLELQAWIMKMDQTREFPPDILGFELFDYRNRVWRIDASWVSSRKLHDQGDET